MPVPDVAAGFATVRQGRDTLVATLHGKRMLVAVDNIWERDPLDALALPGCTILFTTRLDGLARTVGDWLIPVHELTQDQALELLARWVGQPPAALPAKARALCTRVGIWRSAWRWPGR